MKAKRRWRDAGEQLLDAEQNLRPGGPYRTQLEEYHPSDRPMILRRTAEMMLDLARQVEAQNEEQGVPER